MGLSSAVVCMKPTNSQSQGGDSGPLDYYNGVQLHVHAPTPTSNLADVQNISDDVLRDLGQRFSPGDVDGVGGQSAGCETLWSGGEIFGLSYSQPGAGLVGAGAVLRNALVDGLVF